MLCRDAWVAGRGVERRTGAERETAGWGRMCYRPQSAARRLSVCVGSPSRSFRNTVSVTLRSVFILSFSFSSSLQLSLSVSPPVPPSLPSFPQSVRHSPIPVNRHRVPPSGKRPRFSSDEARPQFSSSVLRFLVC